MNEFRIVVEVIGQYDGTSPTDPRSKLLALADVIRLLSEKSLTLQRGLTPVAREIDAIQDALRASLGPVIGTLLGGIAPIALREIEAEIAMHRGAIEREELNRDFAEWKIGMLEYEKRRINALFERFVRKGEDLKPRSEA